MDALFLLGGLCLMADLGFGAAMAPWYYIHGIPVLRIRRSVRDGRRAIPSPQALDGYLRSRFLGGVVFADFGGGTYGFRWNLLVGTGITHRIVTFEPYESALEVQARLGYFLPGFLVMAAVVALPEEPILCALVFGTLFLIDALQSLGVASAAQRLWDPPDGRAA